MHDRQPNYWDEYRRQRLADDRLASKVYSRVSREIQKQIFEAEQRGAGPTAADFAPDNFDELTDEEDDDGSERDGTEVLGSSA